MKITMAQAQANETEKNRETNLRQMIRARVIRTFYDLDGVRWFVFPDESHLFQRKDGTVGTD